MPLVILYVCLHVMIFPGSVFAGVFVAEFVGGLATTCILVTPHPRCPFVISFGAIWFVNRNGIAEIAKFLGDI